MFKKPNQSDQTPNLRKCKDWIYNTKRLYILGQVKKNKQLATSINIWQSDQK